MPTPAPPLGAFHKSGLREAGARGGSDRGDADTRPEKLGLDIAEGHVLSWVRGRGEAREKVKTGC
eukprot:6380478-Pyramimonas_sp.AAC.1